MKKKYVLGFDADVDKVALVLVDVENVKIVHAAAVDVLDLEKHLLTSPIWGFRNQMLVRLEIPTKQTAYGAAQMRKQGKRKKNTLPNGDRFNAAAIREYLSNNGGNTVAEEKGDFGTYWDSGRCYQVSQQIARVIARIGITRDNIEEVLSHERTRIQKSRLYDKLKGSDLEGKLKVLSIVQRRSKVFPSKLTQEQCVHFFGVKLNDNQRDAAFLAFPEILMQRIAKHSAK